MIKALKTIVLAALVALAGLFAAGNAQAKSITVHNCTSQSQTFGTMKDGFKEDTQRIAKNEHGTLKCNEDRCKVCTHSSSNMFMDDCSNLGNGEITFTGTSHYAWRTPTGDECR